MQQAKESSQRAALARAQLTPAAGAGPNAAAPNAPAANAPAANAEAMTVERALVASVALAREFGGPAGPEPTRYGDWEKNGRCIDF